MSVTGVVVGGVLLLIGGGIGLYGYRRFRVARAIKSTPTTNVSDLDSSGRIEIEGEIVADESMTSPIGQDEDTVLSAWKVQEWNESRNTTDSWRDLGTGITARPFIVRDETGHVVVDPQRDIVGESELLYEDGGSGPTGGSLGVGFAGTHIGLGRFLPSFSSSVTADGVVTEFDSLDVAYTDSVTESTPDHIQDFVVQQPNLRTQVGQANPVDLGNKDGDRRYYEETIQDGDSVYVLGEVRPTSDGGTVSGPSDGVIQPPAEDGLFVVSTLSESKLLRRTRWQTAILGVGAVIALLGLVSVLSGIAGLML